MISPPLPRVGPVRDVRRWRPNILVGGVEGLSERDWPGAELHVGDPVKLVGSTEARSTALFVP